LGRTSHLVLDALGAQDGARDSGRWALLALPV